MSFAGNSKNFHFTKEWLVVGNFSQTLLAFATNKVFPLKRVTFSDKVSFSQREDCLSKQLK